MEVTAFNIKYDTDGEQVDLPEELTFYIPNEEEIENISDIVSDKISNETGFCHLGFEIKF